MQGIQDQQYLSSEQYATASNLSARVKIHRLFSTNQYGWFPWVFDHFYFSPKSVILELGCGPGSLWKENIQRVPPEWHLTLSDFSAGMVEDARNTLKGLPLDVVFEVIDAQEIPFPDNSFDVVITNHMLYHVPDLEKALSEIARVLKPSGYFYATTVGSNHLRELMVILQQYLPAWVSPPKNFILDNGAIILSSHFDDVDVDYYEDALNVTDPGVLFDYICSLGTVVDVPEATLSALKAFLEEEIRNKENIFIMKESGIFIARSRKKE